jgi:hypothetical protein
MIRSKRDNSQPSLARPVCYILASGSLSFGQLNKSCSRFRENDHHIPA